MILLKPYIRNNKHRMHNIIYYIFPKTHLQCLYYFFYKELEARDFIKCQTRMARENVFGMGFLNFELFFLFCIYSVEHVQFSVSQQGERHDNCKCGRGRGETPLDNSDSWRETDKS